MIVSADLGEGVDFFEEQRLPTALSLRFPPNLLVASDTFKVFFCAPS